MLRDVSLSETRWPRLLIACLAVAVALLVEPQRAVAVIPAHPQSPPLQAESERPIEVAEWLSRDPIGEEGGLNLYGYVGNDPGTWTDPLGLCSTGAEGIVAAGEALKDGLIEVLSAVGEVNDWLARNGANPEALPATGMLGKIGRFGRAAKAAKAAKMAANSAFQRLLKAGQALDKGNLTKAGRALQKHGSRAGSAFPPATGNPAAINQQGQQVLQDILSSQNQVIKPNRFGGRDIFDATTGRGVRYDASEDMMGFLEP
jgi:uncharacterized protein RhaS with RHS repeats